MSLKTSVDFETIIDADFLNTRKTKIEANEENITGIDSNISSLESDISDLDSNKYNRDGTQALTGNLDFGNYNVVNLSNSTGGLGLVNKSYIDTVVANNNLSSEVQNLSAWNASSPSGKYFGGDVFVTTLKGNISYVNGHNYLADFYINQVEPLYGANTGAIGETSKFADIYATTFHSTTINNSYLVGKTFSFKDQNNSEYFSGDSEGIIRIRPMYQQIFPNMYFYNSNNSYSGITLLGNRFEVGGGNFKRIIFYSDKVSIDSVLYLHKGINISEYSSSCPAIIHNGSTGSILELRGKNYSIFVDFDSDGQTYYKPTTGDTISKLWMKAGNETQGGITCNNSLFGVGFGNYAGIRMFTNNMEVDNNLIIGHNLNKNILPSINASGSVGTSALKFGAMHATCFHGNISSGDIFMKNDWVLKEDEEGLLLVKGKKKYRLLMKEID